MLNRKLRKRLIQAIPLLILLAFIIGCARVGAAETEEISQEIFNEKTGGAFQLNSQIREDGKIEKQGIHNLHTYGCISINRNTYKFYYVNNAKD